METESIKVEVCASATPQSPSLGFSSTVVISRIREIEEFTVDDGKILSLRTYPDSSVHDPLIFLSLQDFGPYLHVYQHVHNKLHDRVLSRLITDEIVVESQQRDLPQGPLLITVSVKLTQKEYMVVPCISVSSTTKADESDTCAICLENMSDSEPQLPHCAHRFHELCFIKWLDRHDSCPLCRQSPNQITN